MPFCATEMKWPCLNTFVSAIFAVAVCVVFFSVVPAVQNAHEYFHEQEIALSEPSSSTELDHNSTLSAALLSKTAHPIPNPKILIIAIFINLMICHSYTFEIFLIFLLFL